MTRDEAIHAVDKAFATVPRPTMFICGTCFCDECQEHERTMQQFDPGSLPLELVHDPGWNPLSFASEEAFKYLVPGLVRLVLGNADAFVDGFLFQLEGQERVASLAPDQARAVIAVLDLLALEQTDAVEVNRSADDLFRVRARLEQIAANG